MDDLRANARAAMPASINDGNGGQRKSLQSTIETCDNEQGQALAASSIHCSMDDTPGDPAQRNFFDDSAHCSFEDSAHCSSDGSDNDFGDGRLAGERDSQHGDSELDCVRSFPDPTSQNNKAMH